MPNEEDTVTNRVKISYEKIVEFMKDESYATQRHAVKESIPSHKHR